MYIYTVFVYLQIQTTGAKASPNSFVKKLASCEILSGAKTLTDGHQDLPQDTDV